MGEVSLELGLEVGRGDAWPRGDGIGAGEREGRGVGGGKCPAEFPVVKADGVFWGKD